MARSPLAPKHLVPALMAALGLASSARAQDQPLKLNDKQYFEKRGLNVLVFTNQYNGMFFDEKTAGVELIQHGVRLGDRRRGPPVPTPEQWDQIPKLVDRKVDRAANTIDVRFATRRSTSTRAWSSRRTAPASRSPSSSTSPCPRSSKAAPGSTSSSCRRSSWSTPT